MTPVVVEVVDLREPDSAGSPVSGEPDAAETRFQAIACLVQAVLEEEGVAGEVTVAFVDEERMAELNGQYRGKAGPTDVLSFCYKEEKDSFPGWLDDGGEADELGEIAVCPTVVEGYAREENETPGRRLAWSIVHGVLHLLGYDHEKDQGEMVAREQELLRKLEALAAAVTLP